MPKAPTSEEHCEKALKSNRKRKRDRSKTKLNPLEKHSGAGTFSKSQEPTNKKSKSEIEIQPKSKSSNTKKKVTLKTLKDINSRDKIINSTPECSTGKHTKTQSKARPKKKPKLANISTKSTVAKSSSDDDTETEDMPLSDDLPNYVDKFGVLETKVNRFKDALTHVNIQYLVIDEICLEGLDGITLEALWTRISVATEQPLPFSEGIVRYFWHVIVSRSDIEFYLLQEPREKLVIYDRYENHDPVLGACIDVVEAPLDIYPFHPVKNPGVYGSALSYATRTNVTDEVRKLTLQQAESMYGMKLIMVGSQKLRTKALLSPKVDPNVELTHQEYLLLERIARSRKAGELTQGKISLQALHKDSKTLFYIRKVLLENELITKQQFYLLSLDSHHTSCTLLHLYRFFNIKKTKSQIMTEQIVEVLRKRPHHRMDCADARRVFGHSKSLKKLFKFQEFQKLVKVDMCYRIKDLYPGVNSKQWQPKGYDGDKLVRTIELINPSINVGGSWNDEEAKDDSSDDETSKEMIFNRPLLYQIYMFIHDSGQNGISLKEIRNSTGFDYYSIRSAIKTLSSTNYICGLKNDMGRQRVTRYRCNYQENPTKETPEVVEQETLDFISNVLGISDTSLLAKPKKTLQPITSTSGAGKYALIKQLRKQNKPENAKLLEDIFKNQHEYVTAKNNLKFNPYVGRLDIFNSQSNINSEVVQKRKLNLQQIGSRIKELSVVKDFKNDTDISCPLDLGELSKSYQQLCSFIFKLVQPILIKSKYEIKVLEPRYRYECKQQLPKDKLEEFSKQTLEHIETNADANESTERTDNISYSTSNKTIKYNIYMGPKPELIYQAKDENDIEVTIMASTKPHEFGETSSSYVKDNNATLRTLKRTKFVIDTIQQEKIVTDVYSITKLLANLDNEEGYKAKIDKKSVDRIYMRLVKAGLIRALRVTLQLGATVRGTTVLCDAAYDLQNTVIESLIEQLKMKLFSTSSTTATTEEDQFNTKQIASSVGELNLLAVNNPPYMFRRNIGRDYGNAPKFMRMRILHEFMFYLVYEYPSDVKPIVTENSDMPPVYSLGKDWKMFVPPLPKHKGWPRGWTLVCDLLLRLPLSLFVKLCNVSFIIPELAQFLEDPVKQHVLVKFLPPDIRNALLYKRRYIFTIHEVITRLCYIGLVQFGPQKLRDKDQVFVYLNRHASLWDTTVSAPGYHYVQDRQYKQLKYHFKNSECVDNYWYEVWNICMHTKLGLRNTVTGTYITIEQLERKPAMIEAMKPQTPESVLANDDGRVPGDKRGAAGFDSAIWSHVKRNWIWSDRARQQKPVATPKKKFTTPKPKDPCIINKRGKNFIRKVLPRKDYKSSTTRSEYDAIDRKLMERLQQSRPEWVESEDKILHICKMVTMFIYRTSSRPFIPYTVIRDVLHTLSPISANKTSGAVRRRLFNIFGPTDQQELFQQIAKSLDYIPYVRKYFHTISLNDKQAIGAFVFLTTYFFKHQNEMQHVLDVLLSKTPIPEVPESTEVLEVVLNDPLEKPKRTTLYSKLSMNHPQTENDIILDTIQSIIHSSLSCQQNEIGWLIQLFYVYRKYPQDFLKKALDDLRANHLTSGRGTVVRKVKNIEGLPIITKFFQFSHYYCYTQITKYPPELFIEAHEIFLGIWKNSYAKYIPMDGFKQGHTVGLAELAVYVDTYFNVDIPQEVLVLNPNLTDHSELIRELAVRYKKMLTLVKSGVYFNDTDQRVKYGCRWPMIHRFLRSWFLSDDVEIDAEDADVENTVETTGMLPKISPIISQEEGKKILGDLNPVRATENNDTTFEDYEKKLESFLSTNDGIENTEEIILCDTSTVDESNILRNYLSALKKSKTKSNENSEVIAEKVQEDPEKEDERIQYLMSDKLTVEQIMEEMLKDCPPEERKVPKPTNLARLLVIGLFPELDEDEERLERLYKHFLVICPETKFLLPVDLEVNTTLNYLHSEELKLCKKLLEKVERDNVIDRANPDMEAALAKLKIMGGSDVDVVTADKLVNYAYKKKCVGATVKELKEQFSTTKNLSLADILKTLTEMNLLMRAGITHFVYVHHEYRTPWLVESCILGEEDRSTLKDTNPETLNTDLPSLSSLQSYQEIKIRVKPWTLIDGSLHIEVFQKWIYTVLGHCLSEAVLPLTSIIELCAFLKPVDVYYLLECLQELGCVKLITYKQDESTLLSTHVYSESADAEITDDFQDIYIDCDTLAMTRLGSLLNTKRQSYNFNIDEPSRYDSF